MSEVSVIHLAGALIATVPQDLNDSEAMDFREVLTARVEQTDVDLVLLDLSALEVVDSFIGRLLSDIGMLSRLLGAETIIFGMQPAVAMTLVELGLELKGVRTALTAERALAMARKGRQDHGGNGRR